MPLLNTRKIALLSVLVAVSIGIQLTPRPPNVELTSLLTFLVGILYGSLIGGFFGGLVMFVNGFLSPWGFAGFAMPFQIAGMTLTGFAGGTYKKYLIETHLAQAGAEVAILGAFLTFLYDAITTIGVATEATIVGNIPWHISLITTFSVGAAFYLVHTVSNFVLFGLGLIPLLEVFQRIPGGEALWSKKEPLHSQH